MLKPTGSSGLAGSPNVFALVCRNGEDEAVIADGLFAGEALEWVGATAGAVRVKVFQSGLVLAVLVAVAAGNAYASAPEWTSQHWYESTDRGRTWARRREPIDGLPVITLSRGSMTGWDG